MRETGYYWVKIDLIWHVAEWSNLTTSWMLTGVSSDRDIKDDMFTEIGPKIELPS